MSDFYNKYPYTDFHELNLDWIIGRVKQLTEDWLETKQAWENTEADWQELYDYVHDYFNNLDVQEEINNKVNAMIADGTFVTITTPVIEAKVASMMPSVVSDQIGGAVAAQINGAVADQIVPVVAEQLRGSYGSPLVSSTVAGMTDHQRVYVYTGSESGYVNGNWYYWDGSAWTSGGVYNSSAITLDDVISMNSVNAVKNKVIAKRVWELESALDGATYSSYDTIPGTYSESSQSFLLISATPIGQGYMKNITVYLGAQTGTVIRLYNLSDDGASFELLKTYTFDASSGLNTIAINEYFDKPVYIGYFAKLRYTSTSNENPLYVFNNSNSDVDIVDALNTTYSLTYITATYDKLWENMLENNESLYGTTSSTYTGDLPVSYSEAGQSYIQLNPITMGHGFISSINVFLSALNNSKIHIYTLSSDETKYELKKAITFNAVDGLNTVPINYYTEKDCYIGLFAKCRYVATPNENPDDVFNYSAGDLTIADKLARTYSHFFYTVNFTGAAALIGNSIPYTQSSSLVIVSKNTEYDTIQKGINAVEANGTVLVYPGVYLEQIDTRAKNVNIIGVDKTRCILKDTSGMYDTPPLEISGGSVQNMTIIETGEDSTPSSPGNNPTLAYCIHVDFNQEENNSLLLSNCILRCNKRAAIGCGVRRGFQFTIENCDIWSGVQEDTGHLPRGAIYIHTQSDAVTTPIANILLKDNIIACEDSLTLCLEDYAGIGFSMTSINNMVYSAISGKTDAAIKGRDNAQFAWSSDISNNVRSYGNNISLLNA